MTLSCDDTSSGPGRLQQGQVTGLRAQGLAGRHVQKVHTATAGQDQDLHAPSSCLAHGAVAPLQPGLLMEPWPKVWGREYKPLQVCPPSPPWELQLSKQQAGTSLAKLYASVRAHVDAELKGFCTLPILHKKAPDLMVVISMDSSRMLHGHQASN